jgi:hypothetical protein
MLYLHGFDPGRPTRHRVAQPLTSDSRWCMNTPFLPCVAGVCVLVLSHAAHAWEFRWRFVERVGNVDLAPLANDTIDASTGEPRRIRLQFGVFDDDAGPAPGGGFIGWNGGSVVVSGTPANSDERRTPGRLTPFFTQGHGNGEPAIDPFDAIIGIDAVMGLQGRAWRCNPDGTPAPMPPARTWGLNRYDAVFELTIDPAPGAESYSVVFGGSLIAATEWRLAGEPWPPDCGDPANPDDDQWGSVTYAPFPTAPRMFEGTLHVYVPAPSAVVVAVAGLLGGARRRRR